MRLQDAFELFRGLGVHPEMMSRADFTGAYFRLARRYHPDARAVADQVDASRKGFSDRC